MLDSGDGKAQRLPDYTLPLVALTERYGIPTIFYDQFGNGKSTHVREKNGDEAFFTTDLYRRELDNLVDHLKLRERGFGLLGHSWGGMLAAMYATDHHADSGLKKIILSNSPAKMQLWSEAARRLRAAMPEIDKVLSKCEAEGRLVGDKEYEEAAMEFYKRHVCRVCKSYCSCLCIRTRGSPASERVLRCGLYNAWVFTIDIVRVIRPFLHGAYPRHTCYGRWQLLTETPFLLQLTLDRAVS